MVSFVLNRHTITGGDFTHECLGDSRRAICKSYFITFHVKLGLNVFMSLAVDRPS